MHTKHKSCYFSSINIVVMAIVAICISVLFLWASPANGAPYSEEQIPPTNPIYLPIVINQDDNFTEIASDDIPLTEEIINEESFENNDVELDNLIIASAANGCVNLGEIRSIQRLREDLILLLCDAIRPTAMGDYWGSETQTEVTFPDCEKAQEALLNGSTVVGVARYQLIPNPVKATEIIGQRNTFQFSYTSRLVGTIEVKKPTWEGITTEQSAAVERMIDLTLKHERGHLHLAASVLLNTTPISIDRRINPEKIEAVKIRLSNNYTSMLTRAIADAQNLYDKVTNHGIRQSVVGGENAVGNFKCPPKVAIVPTLLNDTVVGEPYQQQFTLMVDGQPAITPVEWSITSAEIEISAAAIASSTDAQASTSLLTISPTGLLSWTPPQAGAFPITISAKGKKKQSATIDLILNVKSPQVCDTLSGTVIEVATVAELTNAIASAIPGSVIHLGPGRYDLVGSSTCPYCLLYIDKNLTIAGSGESTTLVIPDYANKASQIRVVFGDVTFRDLNISYNSTIKGLLNRQFNGVVVAVPAGLHFCNVNATFANLSPTGNTGGFTVAFGDTAGGTVEIANSSVVCSNCTIDTQGLSPSGIEVSGLSDQTRINLSVTNSQIVGWYAGVRYYTCASCGIINVAASCDQFSNNTYNVFTWENGQPTEKCLR